MKRRDLFVAAIGGVLSLTFGDAEAQRYSSPPPPRYYPPPPPPPPPPARYYSPPPPPPRPQTYSSTPQRSQGYGSSSTQGTSRSSSAQAKSKPSAGSAKPSTKTQSTKSPPKTASSSTSGARARATPASTANTTAPNSAKKVDDKKKGARGPLDCQSWEKWDTQLQKCAARTPAPGGRKLRRLTYYSSSEKR